MHPVVGSAVDMFHQASQAVPTPPVMAPPPPVVPVYAPAAGGAGGGGDVSGLPYDPYNTVKKRRKPPQPPPAPPVTTLLVTEEKTNMQSAAELGVIGGKSTLNTYLDVQF